MWILAKGSIRRPGLGSAALGSCFVYQTCKLLHSSFLIDTVAHDSHGWQHSESAGLGEPARVGKIAVGTSIRTARQPHAPMASTAERRVKIPLAYLSCAASTEPEWWHRLPWQHARTRSWRLPAINLPPPSLESQWRQAAGNAAAGGADVGLRAR